MSPGVDTNVRSPELVRFTEILSERLGLSLAQEPEKRLAELLAERSARTGARDERRYLERLENPLLCRKEMAILADALAVRESYFFRNHGMFDAIGDHVLADLDASRPRDQPLRLLSAGCAAGEEPYSLAMLLRETSLSTRRPVVLEAFDASAELVEQARRGVFSEWAFRELSNERRDRWFRQIDARNWRLDRSIVDAVRFSVRNLLDPDPAFWKPGRFDLILCRNVLIYFTPAAIQDAVDRLVRSLAPGGYLFLGHAETLHGRGRGLRLHHSRGAFYYQRELPGRGQRRSRPSSYEPATTSPPPSSPTSDRDGWARRIHDFTSRIEALLPSRRGKGERSRRSDDGQLPSDESRSLDDRRRANLPGGVLPSDVADDRFSGNGADSTERLDAVLRLVEGERFGEALALTSPDRSADSSRRELRVARAAILLMVGDVEAAGRLCRELLAEDELDATVHYIDGIRRKDVGDDVGAREELRAAAFLDSRFALPRLQLGILAHRQGDTVNARRELEHAVRLLPEERPGRVTLLGGGLDRSGLTRLALRELRNLEGGR